MHDTLSKLIETNDVENLNRLVATSKIDKNQIISNYKDVEPDLFVDKSNIHGLGVFSKYPIRIGQIIETVHIIQLEFSSKYHKDLTIINYCYALPDQSQETIKHGNMLYMFTGFGMLYNHNTKEFCNAKWVWDLPNQQAKLLATKSISQNSEITIDYGKGYWQR
jgi:SET domain-containing protein